MFTKSAATIATLLVAATLPFTTAANAGGCHGGGHHAYQSRPSASYAAQLRAKQAAQARAIAAAQRRKQIEIAEARAAQKARAQAIAAREAASEASTEQAENAKTEGSTAAAVATADETTNDDVSVASVKTTCSKFIAATGTTVEVECAAE